LEIGRVRVVTQASRVVEHFRGRCVSSEKLIVPTTGAEAGGMAAVDTGVMVVYPVIHTRLAYVILENPHSAGSVGNGGIGSVLESRCRASSAELCRSSVLNNGYQN